jgi:hypothetical protein
VFGAIDGEGEVVVLEVEPHAGKIYNRLDADLPKLLVVTWQV